MYDSATKQKTHVKARDYGMQVPRTERQAKALERAALNARDARRAAAAMRSAGRSPDGGRTTTCVVAVTRRSTGIASR
jgi:hypothetical protein